MKTEEEEEEEKEKKVETFNFSPNISLRFLPTKHA